MGARGPKPNAEMDERVTTVRRELRAMGFEGGATQIAAVISYDMQKMISADSVRARLRRLKLCQAEGKS